MKIIEPSAELVDKINPDEILRKIELCGRVSHQSQPREDSAENFVRMLIKRGHESVLEHVSLTFHIICDRAIMAELTRHRLASFTVESTRYVKYNDLEFIAPDLPADSLAYRHWYSKMFVAEETYNVMINDSARPEQARSILPLCLKTELYMTANLRELRHILKLRCSEKAHPQMRLIAGMILDVFKDKLPVIVEDINHEGRLLANSGCAQLRN